MTTKLEQAARQIIVDWDSGIHLYEAIAALRKALAERKVLTMTQEEMVDAIRSAKIEQAEPNSTFMEGYRIGLAEMREKCATVSEQGTGEAVQKAALEILINERKRIASAIRAIKFEGDTGFRPVSEMIAEHKQDPKKGAAIEKAKTRKATRAEKIAMPGVYEVPVEQAEQEPVAEVRVRPLQGYESTPKIDVEWLVRPTPGFLYAAPVRTKDLTDDEILDVALSIEIEFSKDTDKFVQQLEDIEVFARAVIAAYKEKNK